MDRVDREDEEEGDEDPRERRLRHKQEALQRARCEAIGSCYAVTLTLTAFGFASVGLLLGLDLFYNTVYAAAPYVINVTIY